MLRNAGIDVEYLNAEGYQIPSLHVVLGSLFTLQELAALLTLLGGFFPKEQTAFMAASKRAHSKLQKLIGCHYEHVEPALKKLVESFKKSQSHIHSLDPDGT